MMNRKLTLLIESTEAEVAAAAKKELFMRNEKYFPSVMIADSKSCNGERKRRAVEVN